jgi:hypothetical protein
MIDRESSEESKRESREESSRESISGKVSQKPIHPLERISSTNAHHRKQATDVISALSTSLWCTDFNHQSQNMSSIKFSVRLRSMFLRCMDGMPAIQASVSHGCRGNASEWFKRVFKCGGWHVERCYLGAAVLCRCCAVRMNRGGGGRVRGAYGYSYWFPTLRKNA